MVNRVYPIVHNDTVLASGTRQLSFEQPESLVDLSDGNASGVRFHLDVHGTTGTFDSFKLRCKFQLGMFDIGGAGFSEMRWHDLQPEQISTMIMEGVDWYTGSGGTTTLTNLVPNPSWVNSEGGAQAVGDGAATPSRPEDGGYSGPTYRRLTFTKATTTGMKEVLQSHGRFPVTAGKQYSASIRFAANRNQRFHVGLRWYAGSTTLTGQDTWAPSAEFERRTIKDGHLGTVVGAVAPAGATDCAIIVNSVEGEGGDQWLVGDTFDIDCGLLVEGSYLPPYFDGDSTDAAWSGTPHASTSVLTRKTSKEMGVVATSGQSLPQTVSRSIKGFGQFVRVYIKPEFVNPSADAGVTYSLSASH